jgi:hypothetical protein
VAVARCRAALKPEIVSGRIDTVAVKRSDPRNALQPRAQTPDDFISVFLGGYSMRGEPESLNSQAAIGV